MAGPNFDVSQNKAINIEKNTVVSAGAGSGKTSVLSARFAHLVLDKKYKVEEILTLTFTKKATVEMYGRIYKTLKEKDPDSVKDFYKANIKTLDSYCAYIAKTGAHFYGISPSFTVDKKAAEEAISSMALPFILEHRNNPGLKALLTPQNHQQIADELFTSPMLANSPIAEPIDFYAELEKQRKKIKDDWAEYCQKSFSTIDEIKEAVDEYEGNKNTKLITALSAALEKGFPDFPVLDEDTFKNSSTEKMVSFVFFVGSFAKVPLTGKCPEDIKELVKQLREIQQKLISMTNFVSGGKITESLIPLMEEFQKKANDVKRKRSILTYADVSSLALKTLIDHPEIRRAEKKKYKSIMIDEFQDNNEMQKKLLFLLAEKIERTERSVPDARELYDDKLFFVGDEKQSIYRFRGADVSVFRGLSDDFKDGNLKLMTNYRSTPALIAAFNTIFGGTKYPLDTRGGKSSLPSVFFNSEEKGLAEKYEPVYTDAEISEADQKKILEMDEKAFKKFYEPKIHMAFYEKENDSEADELTDDEAQAAWVVNEIKKLIDEKKAEPDDIAVLFRNYKYQPTYEKNLLYSGIPYNSETITGFFNSSVVSDIFSFLRICAYPNDLLAFQKVLESSVVNLSVEEVDSVLCQSGSAFEQDGENILNGKSKARYRHAKEIYEKISEDSKNQPIAKTVTDFWYSFGYRYETMWNQRATMYSTLYDRIFELARNADTECRNLSDFVDSVRTYEDESKHLDDMDIPMEQKKGVHLMTIHKSKGLQFKYVFITNVDHGSAKDKNASKVFVSKEFGLTINTPKDPALSEKSNYFWDLVSEEDKKMAQAELKRLVYVAVTRAIEEVYVTGCTGGRKNSDSIYEILNPVIEYFSNDENKAYSPFTVTQIPPMQKNAPLDFVSGKKEVIGRLEEYFENAAEIEYEKEEKKYVNPSSHDAEPEHAFSSDASGKIYPFSEIDEIVKNKPGFSLADFGTIAHGFMEAAINGCEPKIKNSSIQGLEGNKKYLEEISSACKRMKEQFMKTKVAKEAVSSKWRKAEYSFKSFSEGKIISGQIDLVYENQDGGYTVVDYKTNREIKPEIYYTQLGYYKKAVSEMRNVPEEKVRCVLYYLRHGKEIEIG
ncbi:MAG: UvrD-helicase domain-containing protein [Treponema sp.]|nr:UvrD-helicase domain-containing protein [Treponema sp.]